MLNYKQRVMDDLDALLADLQSTTAQINSYQHQHQGNRQQQQSQPENSRDSFPSDRRSRSDTPPPLPPPPAQELLDSIPPPPHFDQPIYEPQQVVIRERTPSSDGTSLSSEATFQNKSPATHQMSALSNNLSELDQLLQDLNSAQFMAEVDKRNAVNQHAMNGSPGRQAPDQHVMNGSPGRQAPAVAPKPSRRPERGSVDILLDQLENAVPSPQTRTPGASDGYSYTGDNQPQQAVFSHHQHQQTMTAPQPMHAASSATRELDDLMASLTEFKMTSKPGEQSIQDLPPPPQRSPSPQSEPPYARPNKSRTASTQSAGISSPPPSDQLESMLGDLKSDMAKQGTSAKTKGVCAACHKPVVGQVITALGKIWHVEHFSCAHCQQSIGTKNFYERDDRAYCENDYHALFAPRCAYCNGPIVDKCITALDRTWHPEHFFCAMCGLQFGEDGFHERDGKAYCTNDYFEKFAPKCGGCGRPIVENYISALNRHWHPECFVCWDCHMPFGSGSFFDHEGLPYCETHYHAKKGSLCAGCQTPITGRCITAMFKKFHPEHFVCAFCLKQLNKGTFKEQNDKPYCHPCFVKLFG